MLINNQRPGVYSHYDIAYAYAVPQSAAYAAVVAKAAGGTTEEVCAIASLQQLQEAFPPDSGGATLRGCVQILLQAGVTKVYAVAVEGDFYEDALALVEELDNVGAVICDCSDSADRLALRDSVQRSSDALRERLAFCGEAETAAACTAAEALNSERVVLCSPAVRPHGGGSEHAVYGAAALAGRMLALGDPVWNFNGETLITVQDAPTLPETQVQNLLAAGVTVLEPVGGTVECVRALTTRTHSDGEQDYALRSMNAVLCIDDVMRAMRRALKGVLRGVRLPARSLSAIRSQAAVVLAEKQSAGILASYGAPTVRAHGDDPTIAVVELDFQVAHVISQIRVTAHIQV